MKRPREERQLFSIRKYHFGAASVLLGAFLGLTGTSAQAAETTPIVAGTVTETELETAKSESDKLAAAVKVQEPIVATADNQVKTITANKETVKTNLDTEKAAKENIVDTKPVVDAATQKLADENKKLTDAKQTVNTTKSKANQVTKLESDFKTATSNRDAKKEEVKNLEASQTAPVSAKPEFKVSKEFVDALLKREEYAGSLEKVENNDIDLSNPVHKSNDDLLVRLGQELATKATYKGTETEQVNIWNMTDAQKKEVNFFALDIINQIRAAFGNPALETTQGAYEFTQEIADKSTKKFEVDYSTGTASTRHYKYGYEYKLINETAVKYGLATHLQDSGPLPANPTSQQLDNWNNDQRQQDFTEQKDAAIAVYNLPSHYDKFGSPEFDKLQPVVTMGQLKEIIYNGFKQLMFKKAPLSEKRSWELALSTAGEYYRVNTKYAASAVTARLYTWPDANRPAGERYESKGFRIYLHNNYIKDERDNVNEPNRIMDPSKFNETVLKNDTVKPSTDPALLKAAQDELAKLEVTLTEVNTKLTEAKKAAAELPKVEEALKLAEKTVKDAEKALEDAKKLATDTEKDKIAKEQKIANLQKQYDELCAKLTEAQKTLTDETDKLNKLKQDATDADKKYQDLLAKQNQTQPQPPANNNNGVDNGQVTPPSNNGGDNGQVTPPSNGKGEGQYIDLPTLDPGLLVPQPPVQGPGDGGNTGNNNNGGNGQVTPPSNGKGEGQYIDLPTLDPGLLVPQPPVQGPGDGGNTGNNNNGGNGQVTPPSNNNGGDNGQVTPPTQGTNKPVKSNAVQKVTAKATSSANVLPKTTATTETNSALPAGLAAALAAAGLLVVKRRKEN